MNESINKVRSEIIERLGKDRIQQLHKSNKLYDYAAIVGAFTAFVSLAACLAILPFGILWVLCLILQGFLLQVMALINHDVIMHRAAIPKPFSYIVSLMLTIPVHLSPTRYRYGHTAHHRHLGGDGDSELFKIDIDTPVKRLLYATVIGLKMASGGKFARQKRRINPPIIKTDMLDVKRRIKFENRLISVFILISIGLAVVWPQWVFFGYLLPLLTVTPVANTLRTALEHSEFDTSNPYQLGCYYRTGPLTKLLFFWDSGDCHFVHHIFPGIPYYRIGTALRDMRPVFLENGVIERRSFLGVVWVWFSGKYPYRSARVFKSAHESV